MPACRSSGSGWRVAAPSVRTAERNSTWSHIRQSSGARRRLSMPDSAYTARIGLDLNIDWSEPVGRAYFFSAGRKSSRAEALISVWSGGQGGALVVAPEVSVAAGRESER